MFAPCLCSHHVRANLVLLSSGLLRKSEYLRSLLRIDARHPRPYGFFLHLAAESQTLNIRYICTLPSLDLNATGEERYSVSDALNIRNSSVQAPPSHYQGNGRPCSQRNEAVSLRLGSRSPRLGRKGATSPEIWPPWKKETESF